MKYLSVSILLYLLGRSSGEAEAFLEGKDDKQQQQKGEQYDGRNNEVKDEERKRLRPHKISLSPRMSRSPLSPSPYMMSLSPYMSLSPQISPSPHIDMKPMAGKASKNSKSQKKPKPKSSKVGKSATAGKASKEPKSQKESKSSKRGKPNQTLGPTPSAPIVPTNKPTNILEARIQMTIPSGLYLQDFAVDDYEDDAARRRLQESYEMKTIDKEGEYLSLPAHFLTMYSVSDALMVLSATIKEVAEGGLGEGQSVNDVRIKSIETVSADDVDYFKLVQYDLVLNELCGVIRCEELALTSTMYSTVTTHMSQEVYNRGFTAVLQENLVECGEGCSDLVVATVASVTFGEGIVEVITSMPTSAPTPATFIPTNLPTMKPTPRPTANPTSPTTNSTPSPSSSPTTTDRTSSPSINPPTTSPEMPPSFPPSNEPTSAPTIMLEPCIQMTIPSSFYLEELPVGNSEDNAERQRLHGLNAAETTDAGMEKVGIPTYEPTKGPSTTFAPTACPASNVNAIQVEVDTTTIGTNVGGPKVTTGYCGTSIPNHSNVAWYRVVGTGNTLTASTCNNADFDTKMVVYCNCIDPSNYCVGGNDDSSGCSDYTTRYSWPSINGQEYLIMVFGYKRKTGRFELTLTDDGIPANAPLGQCDYGVSLPAVLATAVKKVAEGGLSEGQSVNDVRITSIESVNADDVDKEDEYPDVTEIRGANVAKDIYDDYEIDEAHKGLQDLEEEKAGLPTMFPTLPPDFLRFQYEIVLDELCGSISCEELTNTTTMYQDVTSYMIQKWINRGFEEILREVLIECGSRCDDIVNGFFSKFAFGEGIVEVITSMPTPAPISTTLSPAPFSLLPTTFLPSSLQTPMPTVCLASDVPEATQIDVDATIPGTNVGGPAVTTGFCGTSITDGSNVAWYRIIGTGNTLTASTCNTANFDTKIVVFCNCNEYSNFCIGGNDDSIGCSGFTTRYSWPSINGQEYLVMVVGFASQTGVFDLALTDDGIPANAPFGQCDPEATPLPTLSPTPRPTRLPSTTSIPNSCPASDAPDAIQIEVNTLTTGTNVGGPVINGTEFCDTYITDGSNVAWYRVVGTGNTLTASTCNAADFDSKIVVYCNCNEYSNFCIGGNDDSSGCSGFTSRYSWPSINDQEYLIMVFGYRGQTGGFDLALTDDGIPANALLDQCGASLPTLSPTPNPTRLPTTHFPSLLQTSMPTTTQFPSPMPTACPTSDVSDENIIGIDTTTPGTNVGGPIVSAGFCGISITESSNVAWYRIIGTGNTLTASTCNAADFDTKIVVYCNCNDYSNYCIGGNDDSSGCSGFTTQYSWPSINGQEYLIMVLGFGGRTGSFELTLTDDGISANARLGQCDSGAMIPSPNCVPGYTCLQNDDFGVEDTTKYKIDLSVEMLDPANVNAYIIARDKWMEVITGDLTPRRLSSISDSSPCTNSPPAIIDDLHICGLDGDIDGPGGILGQAGPLWVRVLRDDFGNLQGIQTTTGQMVFDITDVQMMVGENIWENAVKQAMGSVVGFGTLWRFLVVNETLDYFGEQATRVWQNDWDCVGTPPVEKDFGPGSQGVNWDEDCLGNELMTTFLSPGLMPLSSLTIASLEDLGYTVDYNAADEYDGGDTTCCSGNNNNLVSSQLSNPPLSKMSLDKAIDYGRKVLREKQRPSKTEKDDNEDNGMMYVGDHLINVFIEENGFFYYVQVTRGME